MAQEDEDHVYLLCEDDAVPFGGSSLFGLLERDRLMQLRLSPHFTEEFTRLLHATKLHDPWWEAPFFRPLW